MSGFDSDSFDKAVLEVEKVIIVETVDEAKKVAIRASQAVILATPVDTGRARNNWQASLDSPVTEEMSDLLFDTTGLAAISKNNSEINKFNPPEEGGKVYISNNLEYIGALNDGHSAQAVGGYVEIAIEAAKNGI